MRSINQIRNLGIRGRAVARGMMTRLMVTAVQMAVAIAAMEVMRATKAIARRSVL